MSSPTRDTNFHDAEVALEVDAELLVVDRSKSIIVWAFGDAPKAYRDMCTAGSPFATWMALVPTDYPREVPWITESIDFASATVDTYDTDCGRLYVGSSPP